MAERQRHLHHGQAQKGRVSEDSIYAEPCEWSLTFCLHTFVDQLSMSSDTLRARLPLTLAISLG